MDIRKIILSVLGLLLIAGAVFAAKWIIDSNVKTDPEVQKVVKNVFFKTVKNDTVPISIPANGNVTALRKLELYAEVQGIFRNSSKNFLPGQEYKKGQILLNIDSAEYAASVQSAKSDLYNSITAIMPDLRLDYPDAFEKWQKYLSNFDINKSVPELPEIETDKEKYFISGRGIVSSYYTIKNFEERLRKYTIVAPFNGILTEALVKEGTLIRSGQKLGEYIDPSVYELQVSIAKKFSDLLAVGEEVKLQNLDRNQTYNGTVSRINGRVNLETQTIQVFIRVEGQNIQEGMYLEAMLDAKKEPNALEIPRELLVERSKVYVVRDSVLDLVSVQPVYFNTESVVVKGLEDGTKMLAASVPGAYAGQLVNAEEVKDTAKNE
ncbi:efflux RND transporter periplasmic adaptor subunit [Zunongwangia endophytica]|uniref:Efflux RND transporter periplasmic adaptor subunit n=1 Tax=Zunongwangia endophytica TaxID=1808945 RepID=A0ABV8H4Y9_9FLAO|nr:HlyD family efflux transporter periplasmic adaptor subunit [Zunongwangia endophytica]MDN3595398.1 HlyD family efflux transporter periplasmic adaptor subunit [Zunongwangia endophytica]